MNSYESAWAYLQGALEALTPLLNEATAPAIKERLMEAAQVGRGLSLMNDIPEPEMETIHINKDVLQPGSSAASSGSVFFPHDLQRSGNGTFTPPEPTEEEIEELLRRRSGG